MYLPNRTCTIRFAALQTDVYGRAIHSGSAKEPCAVVRLIARAEKSSVRADTSASRGAAIEETVDGVILLGPRTAADYDDLVEIDGELYKVVGKHRRYDVNGRLDHIETYLMNWAEGADE